ncbi:uncharacterized protein LOC110829123 [Zootermopsis nevadensis]|uniref:uncharacterized protein LOC110829123 n=1 Tax=Zootermopsis nevadensis TaxID=136037 RepID=UPI000B8E4529|nr:uncharacterized protein LOC110829123 [Zootermopsis nevadensis]
MGSNPTQGTDVCPHLLVSCCPVDRVHFPLPGCGDITLLLTFRYYTHRTARRSLKCQPASTNARVSCVAQAALSPVGGVGRLAVGEDFGMRDGDCLEGSQGISRHGAQLKQVVLGPYQSSISPLKTSGS